MNWRYLDRLALLRPFIGRPALEKPISQSGYLTDLYWNQPSAVISSLNIHLFISANLCFFTWIIGIKEQDLRDTYDFRKLENSKESLESQYGYTGAGSGLGGDRRSIEIEVKTSQL